MQALTSSTRVFQRLTKVDIACIMYYCCRSMLGPKCPVLVSAAFHSFAFFADRIFNFVYILLATLPVPFSHLTSGPVTLIPQSGVVPYSNPTTKLNLNSTDPNTKHKTFVRRQTDIYYLPHSYSI